MLWDTEYQQDHDNNDDLVVDFMIYMIYMVYVYVLLMSSCSGIWMEQSGQPSSRPSSSLVPMWPTELGMVCNWSHASAGKETVANHTGNS